MELLEAVKARHSVRKYKSKKIEGEVLNELTKIIDECNAKSGLKMKLCVNDSNAFKSMMAHYGGFENVNNYIAIVGNKSDEGNSIQEKAGYYGEKIVIKATQLGLNTCWVAATYNKKNCDVNLDKNEKLIVVIAIGYGENDGVSRKTKPIEKLCSVKGEMPSWFKSGMEAVQLAPTAVNKQKFLFTLDGDMVEAKALMGFSTKIDLGIVKYHFEIGANSENWKWKQ